MSAASNLLEKYSGAGGAEQGTGGHTGGADPSGEIRQSLVEFIPGWENYEATKKHEIFLKALELDAPAETKKKQLREDNCGIFNALLDACTSQEEKLIQWILTFVYDMLREDSSTYSLFEEGKVDLRQPLMSLLQKQKQNQYTGDKAAWLLSAVIGNAPGGFSESDVQALLQQLTAEKPPCTQLGVLEAIANLLKADRFRNVVWATQGVPECIFKISPSTDPSPHVYRCVFAIWMLSFDEGITASIKKYDAVPKLKGVLTTCRTEKVVRLTLTVLKNLLQHKSLSEEIVEEGVLDAVQQLEYEKWRDSDLYDEIRDVSQLISTTMQEISNFDRYERELKTGKLQWGFIHSSKFWAENVNKFETNDFRAIKSLAALLLSESTDSTTLAVACHDIGEFVTLHPLGKKKVSQLNVKDRVMQLMSSSDGADRDVRREALLCCQKIMLNKWQDIDGGK